MPRHPLLLGLSITEALRCVVAPGSADVVIVQVTACATPSPLIVTVAGEKLHVAYVGSVPHERCTLPT